LETLLSLLEYAGLLLFHSVYYLTLTLLILC